MKKFNSLLFLFALSGLLVTACKTTEEVVSEPKDTATVPVSETELALEEPAADTTVSDTTARQFFASIKRSPCYGTCPTYNMTIYSDGFVEYEGIRSVDMIGKYTTTISNEQLQKFAQTARDIGFMDMEDSYDGLISDLPSATTTIVLDEVRKQVYRRHNYPKRILTLEQLFDDLLTTAPWKDENGNAYPPDR